MDRCEPNGRVREDIPITDARNLQSLVRKRRSGRVFDPSIDEAQIDALVEAFYEKIRQHDRLAALFSAGMSLEWPDHLDRMKAFWRSMLMQTREYDGRPVPAHLPLKGVTPQDFEQWLILFRQTANEVCPSSAAALYINRAETLSRTIQIAIFLGGHIPPQGAFVHGVLQTETSAPAAGG